MTHTIDGKYATPRRVLPERPPHGGYPVGSPEAKEAIRRVREALFVQTKPPRRATKNHNAETAEGRDAA